MPGQTDGWFIVSGVYNYSRPILTASPYSIYTKQTCRYVDVNDNIVAYLLRTPF